MKISKRLAALAACTVLAPLALAACGGGDSGSGGGGGASESAATVDSLTVLDYYSDEPGHSKSATCSASAARRSVSPRSITSPCPARP